MEVLLMKQHVFNPFLPIYEYIPDGEPYVFGDRLYVYGSHDKFNGNFYCENDYVCWSAPVGDLTDWRNVGIIYEKKHVPMCDSDERLLFVHYVSLDSDGSDYLYYS